MGLVGSLQKFNRKERYWLLRNAVGEKIEKLDASFLGRLNEVLAKKNVKVPEDAYWAMDYHFDWLAGAIADFPENTVSNRGGRFENPPEDGAKYRERLVQGNQEDVDFLIAFGTTMILIECKAGTSWSSEQYNSKLARIESLKRFADLYGIEVNIEFVIISPGKTKLELPWFVLEHYGEKEFSVVERCDESGKPSASGSFWRIFTPTSQKLTPSA